MKKKQKIYFYLLVIFLYDLFEILEMDTDDEFPPVNWLGHVPMQVNIQPDLEENGGRDATCVICHEAPS